MIKLRISTISLHFELRLIDVHVDKVSLEEAKPKETAGLTDEEADALNQQSAKMAAFLKSPSL